MNGIQTIMRTIVTLAISIWLIVLEPTFAASDLSFDATKRKETTYSKLLSDLRDKVKDPKLKYGGTNVPVMKATSVFKKKYLLVDLKGSGGGTITIALNLHNDLYVVGYLDKINKNFRSHIFKDAPSDAIDCLFQEATGKNRLIINYKSSYGDIENKAGGRRKVELGVIPLNKFINKIYGEKLVEKDEAQFMLIVIQMISEATKFKYIESMILENFKSYYKPDPKAIELENSWSKISKAIKNSKDGVIPEKQVLVLKDVNDKVWKVSKVQDIVNDMSLLKNCEEIKPSIYVHQVEVVRDQVFNNQYRLNCEMKLYF